MSREYTPVESALLAQFVAHMPDFLSETRCKAGDLDNVFDFIFSENADYGCLLEFGGGTPWSEPPFKLPVWAWNIYGIFFIRFDSNIETKLRSLVDRFITIFDADHTLGGVVPLVRITDIGEADPGEVNDIAFYWLPFTLQAVVR